MIKIKISYSEEYEAAEVVAAIKRSARIRRMKYQEEGKYRKIYIHADAWNRDENTKKHREMYIKNTTNGGVFSIKNPP